MPAASSKKKTPKYPGTRMFATFLAANGGGRIETHGRSISSAAGSRAKTSATPASEPESEVHVPASGQNLKGSFAFFDRNTFSWRTSRPSLFEGFIEFSGTWPRLGTMRNGVVYRLRPWVRLTRDGDCLSLRIGDQVLWRFATMSVTPRPCSGKRSSGANRTELMKFIHPTPTVRGNHNRKGSSKSSGNGLATVMGLMHPTPKASDGAKGGPGQRGSKGDLPLPAFMAMMHQTPTAADSKGHQKYSRGNHTLSSAVKVLHPSPRADGQDNAGGSNSRRTAKDRGVYFGRTLNPEYVEWLMGFPIGYTDLKVSATPSSLKS